MTKEELFNNAIPLAYHLANRMARPCDEVGDIVQIALLGLWIASLKYNPSGGAKFSTYAYQVIRSQILLYYRDDKYYKLNPVSLEQSVCEDITLGETLKDGKDPFEELEHLLLLEQIRGGVDSNDYNLSLMEQQIYHLTARGAKTGEIIQVLNISRQRINYLKRNLIRKIQEKILDEGDFNAKR